MNLLASDYFESGLLCVCVKDTSGKVLYQNQACLELCGNMASSKCEQGCMRRYTFDSVATDRDEGTRYFSNQLIRDNYFDILFINDRKCLTTLLYPLENKHRAELDHLSDFKLTKREQDIICLVVFGHTNAQIAKELHIAKGTLKKHLNNIHKKLPPEVFSR